MHNGYVLVLLEEGFRPPVSYQRGGMTQNVNICFLFPPKNFALNGLTAAWQPLHENPLHLSHFSPSPGDYPLNNLHNPGIILIHFLRTQGTKETMVLSAETMDFIPIWNNTKKNKPKCNSLSLGYTMFLWFWSLLVHLLLCWFYLRSHLNIR